MKVIVCFSCFTFFVIVNRPFLTKNIKDVELPFKRPFNLSKDNSIAIDAYLHCVDFLEKKENIKIENFCVMLPTCPIRCTKDIDKAINSNGFLKITPLVIIKRL
jgi:hypothetical protein